jgi:predicted Co/Zn/Cd cation transporter (cation efflux family)
MIVELVGGLMAHSLAIITDAAHLMTDLSAFALAIFASIIAAHGATPEFSYGFKRAEVSPPCFFERRRIKNRRLHSEDPTTLRS